MAYKLKQPTSIIQVEFFEVSRASKESGRLKGFKKFFSRLLNIPENIIITYVQKFSIKVPKIRHGRGYLSPVRLNTILQTFDGRQFKVEYINSDQKEFDYLLISTTTWGQEIKVLSKELLILYMTYEEGSSYGK